MQMFNDLSNQIKKYRKLKCYTQEQLANLIYVTKQSVSKWELGLSLPTIENIIYLCFYLYCIPNNLLEKEVEKINPTSIPKPQENTFPTYNISSFCNSYSPQNRDINVSIQNVQYGSVNYCNNETLHSQPIDKPNFFKQGIQEKQLVIPQPFPTLNNPTQSKSLMSINEENRPIENYSIDNIDNYKAKQILLEIQHIENMELLNEWLSFMCMSKENKIIDRVILYEKFNLFSKNESYVFTNGSGIMETLNNYHQNREHYPMNTIDITKQYFILDDILIIDMYGYRILFSL